VAPRVDGEQAQLAQNEIPMVEISRRRFLAVTGASLAGSSLALMGFSPSVALAEVGFLRDVVAAGVLLIVPTVTFAQNYVQTNFVSESS
jgi:hypothetical protein